MVTLFILRFQDLHSPKPLHNLSLNNRSLPFPLPMKNIEDNPKKRRPTPQQTAEVHTRLIHRYHRGPEAEEHCDDRPDQSEDIDGDTRAAERPRAEVERSGEARVEDEAYWEDVGTEETADNERDDGVEGGGGTDVYEA